MRKKKTIKQKMFTTYALALLVVVVFFIGVNLTQTYTMMKNQVTDSMTRLAQNTAERVDDKLRQLSGLSERIVFSSDVRRLFFENLAHSKDPVEIYRLTNELNETLYGIIGTKLDFYHMNLIDLQGNRFAFGQEYHYKNLGRKSLEGMPWLDETVEKGGKLVISPMGKSTLNNQTKDVLSLSRGFGAHIGGTIEGAVELQITYEELEELIHSTIYRDGMTEEEWRVVIFDREGNQIYPLSDAKEPQSSVLEKGEYLFFSECESSGWQLLLIVPNSILMEPIFQVVLQILFLGILMVFGIAVFSGRASSAYTEPIYRLYDSVKGLTLEDLNAEYQVDIQSGVDELEQLNKVFNKMVLRLHRSLEEVVESRNMEMHSRMLALQAQMNPHFLYNTLTVISIMADNDEKKNVQWACRNLSDMLSYISSQALQLVSVKEELAHTKSYISLIEMRYMEDIEITVDIPARMKEIQIPKLVIQPLVENAVKYATDTTPVWKIRLSGWTEGEGWFIRVEDNGNGFSKEALEDIREKIAIIEQTGQIPELSLNGMGILNIYLRMHFYYKEAAVFEIENDPVKGARILIGGQIKPCDILST